MIIGNMENEVKTLNALIIREQVSFSLLKILTAYLCRIYIQV